MIIAYRQKYYYPRMAQLIREWVMSCEKCIRELGINPQLTRPPLQNPNEHNNAPEDAMQSDLVPELPPSAMTTLRQPWMYFPAIYLLNRHQIKMPQQPPK